jgi:hypothetical protein
MKPIHLLFAFTLITLTSTAQVNLTNPPYAENFDAIGGGLPAGFSVFTAATGSAAGTASTFTSSATSWFNTNGGFYNCASATGLVNTANPNEQAISTNRALSIRQTAAFGNPGGAFAFRIANTQNKTGFTLTFKLQTLDSSSQGISAWRVDYGFGANPTTYTIAPVTPATFSTGGKTGTAFYVFNRTMTVNFGANLDNKSDIVWIRVWAPVNTADPSYNTAYSLLGFNNTTPTMSGIDDWNLNWTNTPPTSTSNIEAIQNSFAVNGELNSGVQVQFNESVSTPTNIQLVSADGRIVWNKQFGQVRAGQTEFIKPASINSGIYILTIRQKGRVYTRKLVK